MTDQQKQNLDKGVRISEETARDMQKKSVDAHYAKKAKERIFRDDLIASMGEKEWNAIIQGAIDRAGQQARP